MRKATIILIVILAVLTLLILFFFPKSCGGIGGIGGPVTSINCNCIGFKGEPLLEIIFNAQVLDASPISCYGVCLKQTCKTETIWPEKNQTIVGGCAGVQDIYRNECCDNWARENNIVHIMCAGSWTVENNTCVWKCGID